MKKLAEEDVQRVVNAAVASGKLSWTGFQKDADGRWMVPVLSPYHYDLARAIEAEVLRINGLDHSADAGKMIKPVTIQESPYDRCQKHLREAGKAYPRTCSVCGLWGPCQFEPQTHRALESLANTFHEGRAGCVSPGAEGYVNAALQAAEDALAPPPRATGCPDTMDDTGHFAEVDMPAFLKKQAS